MCSLCAGIYVYLFCEARCSLVGAAMATEFSFVVVDDNIKNAHKLPSCGDRY
jgi:hypothetical protein